LESKWAQDTLISTKKDELLTEVIKLKGKIAWAKVYEPDTAFGQENYKIQFYPESEVDWKKFHDSGIQKKTNEDDGEKSGVSGKYFQLVRQSFKMIKGAIVNFTGPVIEDKDGKTIVDYVNSEGRRVYSYDNKDKANITRRGSPILLGNGTTVEITVAVYDTFKGKGHRLEAIRVLDLVEYTRDMTPPELSPLVTNSEVQVQTLSEKLDDEIPFGKKDKKDKNVPW
jgi:hypothetical protein